uniref:Sortilin C-terminal domain-containing protein n=1 Tax=Hucho hucho TaxID=62062 RepID=A0A4W5NTF0_9TELE
MTICLFSDYGYERRREGNCLPAFSFNTAVVSRSCSQGQNYLNSTGYRKVMSNNCIKGVKDMYTPRKQMCPNRAPKGLFLSPPERASLPPTCTPTSPSWCIWMRGTK